MDRFHHTYDAVCARFSQEIRLLLANKYVFAPFWHNQSGVDCYENWEAQLASSQRIVATAIKQLDTVRILCIMFDRLYVSRNQLVHSGAIWNGSVNRNQVQFGATVLGWLLPVFIDIMMDNPESAWGRPFYPVVT